jgi:hypothetical protein
MQLCSKLKIGFCLLCYLVLILATTVYAEPIRVKSVSVKPVALTIELGEKAQISASVLPTNAANRSVSWINADSAVVMLSSEGSVANVHAINAGVSTITVVTSDRGFKAKTIVTVIVPVRTVALNNREITISPGEEFILKAWTVPDDATEQLIIWESSNSAVAMVDQEGTVKAVKNGEARIIARSAYDSRNVYTYSKVTVADTPVVANPTDHVYPPVDDLQTGLDNGLLNGIDEPEQNQLPLYIAGAVLLLAFALLLFVILRRRKHQAAGPAGSAKVWFPALTALTGDLAGQKYYFNNQPLIIGRDPAQARVLYPVESDAISRKHCTISYDPASRMFVLEDSSSNGTFLENGQRLQQNLPYFLHHGSKFSISAKGDTFIVELE